MSASIWHSIVLPAPPQDQGDVMDIPSETRAVAISEAMPLEPEPGWVDDDADDGKEEEGPLSEKGEQLVVLK